MNIEFEKPISDLEATNLLNQASGIEVVDERDDGGYCTIVECVGEYDTFVSLSLIHI